MFLLFVPENNILQDSCHLHFKEGKRKLARKFNLSYHYIDDLISFKGQLHSKNNLSSNERVEKMQKKNEPSLTSMRQMVLEISHSKVRNLSKMEVAILEVFILIFT